MIGALKDRAPRPARAAIRRGTRLLRGPRPAILMYHRIAHESFDPWGLAVEQRNFEAQLQWLARHRTILTVGDFARRHAEGRLARRAVAITFDDAYASAMRLAVPLLQRFGAHATVFLPVQLIAEGCAFWWDELAQIVLGFDGDALRLGDVEVRVPAPSERDRRWRADAQPDTPRQVLFYALWSKLRDQLPSALAESMSQLRAQCACGTQSDGPANPDDIKRLARSDAVDFGSHALTHPSLPRIPVKERQREIVQSRQECAGLTGTPPTAFAYPYGDLDEATRKLVQEAGFDCACTTEDSGVAARDDVLALPRLRVGNWDQRALRARLRYA